MLRMAVSVVVMFAFSTFVSAQVPQTLHYQGVLTDAGGAAVADGSYSIIFSLYNVSSGGSALWEETNSVDVIKGIFNVTLGTIVPLNLPFDEQYWIAMAVQGEDELSPRVPLASSAYSLNAFCARGDNLIPASGSVGIGTTSPSRKLTVRGNILIESASTGDPVAEFGEGLDYAEGFDVSESSTIEPGTVLVIDPDNPGRLTTCTEPYDRGVAGIAAGAKGLGSGVRLGVDRFDCDVAVAGRVYCNVDASDGAVEPGDLLTTSAIQGYAMKATDLESAQGAILGKAMERLERGKKGQILVLVTLQ